MASVRCSARVRTATNLRCSASSTPRNASSAAAVRSAGRSRASTSPFSTWRTSPRRSAASFRASFWHGLPIRAQVAPTDSREGVPSEPLRRLALARSEHRRAARLGKASAWSPPGSRDAGQGGHRRPKACSEWARGVFAVWQYCQNQAVARSGSARDVDLVWLVQ